MSNANDEYIPALSYRFLTPFYDFIQKYVVRDIRYKSLLITQANIQPGHHVLDLGCGAGQLAHHLATRGAAEVVGVDLSERMLERARVEWAHTRVTYRREAMERLARDRGLDLHALTPPEVEALWIEVGD